MTGRRRPALIFALVACMLVALVPIPLLAQTPKVNDLRFWHSPDSTRIVFDVSMDVRHKMFTLPDPLRLVVDIENADLNVKLPALEPDNGRISAIRSGRPNADTLRVVFELKKPLRAKDFVLSPNELYGHRLVVDLDELQSSPTPAQSPSQQTASAARDTTVVTARTAPPGPVILAPEDGKLLIAIDAGHGGEDPGAIGDRGSREKDLTLAIARQLKAVIDQDPRMQSYMVRTGDYYIKLHKRRQMARARNADMFVSIHADAFTRKSARGMSVFALSQRGATSAMASTLAAKENASDLIGGVSLADKDDVLAKVLVDLSMTNTISESVNFGGRLLREFRKLGHLHSERVEQAGFAVLKSPDIPSVLIETGFITNPAEEQRLRSTSYQRKLAQAIYVAISEYYQQTPYRSIASYSAPEWGSDTFTSLVKPPRPRYHTVVRGDSLSKIADRYGVRLSQLKSANGLRSDVAVLGKRLKLPVNARASQASASAATSRPSTHTVKRGDSLSKISARYNISIAALKRNNGLRSDTLIIGQKLMLSGNSTTASSTPRVHKVRRGDTLSEIAQRYGSTTRKIMQANALRSSTVMLGQTLRIPN